MDPNEVRLRQARAQAATMSSVPSASNPGAAYPAAGSHGGAMDHSEVRLRLTQQQASAWASPVQNSSSPNNAAAASLGGPHLQQTLGQSSQYGSGSRLISPPVSPLPDVQTPRSTSSGQYFPSQYNDQSPYSGQPSHQSSTSHYGIPHQAYANNSIPHTPAQGSVGNSYAPVPAYGPSQSPPVGALQPESRKSALRRFHNFLMKQGSNERRR